MTRKPREIPIAGLDAEVGHAEWLPDSGHVVFIGKEGPGRHAVFMVACDSGDARVVHRFASEHDTPGIAISPHGHDIAFIAPAPDGFFQVFRRPLERRARRRRRAGDDGSVAQDAAGVVA